MTTAEKHFNNPGRLWPIPRKGRPPQGGPPEIFPWKPAKGGANVFFGTRAFSKEDLKGVLGRRSFGQRQGGSHPPPGLVGFVSRKVVHWRRPLARRGADPQRDFYRLGHRFFARVDADQRGGAKVVDENDVHAGGRRVGVEWAVGREIPSDDNPGILTQRPINHPFTPDATVADHPCRHSRGLPPGFHSLRAGRQPRFRPCRPAQLRSKNPARPLLTMMPPNVVV